MSSREQSPGIIIGSEPESLTTSPSHSDQNSSNVATAYKSASVARALSAQGAGAHADPAAAAADGARNVILPYKNGSRVGSSANSINASQPRAASTASSNGVGAAGSAAAAATGPASSAAHGAPTTPSIPRLRLSSSQTRPSAASTAATTTASPTAVPIPVAGAGSGRPPSVPVARAAAAAAAPAAPAAAARLKTPSASMPRATLMTGSFGGAARRSGANAGAKAYMPPVTSAAPNYAAYPADVSKFLKDVIRRREEAMMSKLLPTAQLMDQLAVQAQAAHELIVQQQAFEFQQIAHKRKEAEMKRKEVETTKANREKMEIQKRQHKDDIVQSKNDVAAAAKQTEAEVREKIKTLVPLQPKLNLVQAVMAQIQDPTSDCSLLGALIMEEKQLQKALKADARYNKSKTADVDGGAEPYWWKQCVCASFNIAAIVKQEPHRASIMDVSIATKTAADKKVVVVRDGEGKVVAWAHTRSGPDAGALAEAYLEAKPEVTELAAEAYKGVMWPKEDAVEVTRRAKAAKSPLADLLPEIISILSHQEVGSHEMSKKDVLAAGEAAV